MIFERRRARRQLESKLNEIQMNLENNYKDLTLQSRREAGVLLEELKNKGLLKPGDIEAVSGRLTEYDKKLEHYGHANISSFLKERY